MVDNPQWAAIEEGIKAGLFKLNASNALEPVAGRDGATALNAILVTHSPTIADPGTLSWIRDAIGGRGVVIPDADNGYWPHLLRQLGLCVFGYDPQPTPRSWGDRVGLLSPMRTQLRSHDRDVMLVIHGRSPFAECAMALERYPGPTLLLAAVGNPHGNARLSRALETDWVLADTWRNGVWRARFPVTIWRYERRVRMPEDAWTMPTQKLSLVNAGESK